MKILGRYSLISDQVDKSELAVILQLLITSVETHQWGSVVEFGCYTGTTSLFIRRILDSRQEQYDFHVYDSFDGLPGKVSKDMSVVGEQFVAGELRATKKDFVANFRKVGLTPPVIHKGWFHDLVPSDVPDQVIFAYLDGDFYESIRDSLTLITSKLVHGAYVVVDDYASEALPGAAKAFDEWARRHKLEVRSQASLGIVRFM